ncbi:hypothetical protein AB0I94_34365 [Streptomyces sp. NPDC050147]|uniref:hypothetical protein n=1 Tax=Streptomyces sp. NPDC050147 TaxID=3155513 RepID=UPI00343A1E47
MPPKPINERCPKQSTKPTCHPPRRFTTGSTHPCRVEAVRAIASKYQFDVVGGRLRHRSGDEDLALRVRAGVGSVPVPGGSCHEMNNVRADGHGCPVYYRCYSRKFFTTDFSQLPELCQLREAKAQQLAMLEAAYGSVLTRTP